MKPPVVDVLIIGGGVIGLAALYHISQSREQSVLLLEKSRIGSGASHQSGGFVRAFHGDKERVEWAAESLRYFRARAEQTGFNAIGARYLPDVSDEQMLTEQLKWVEQAGEQIQMFEQSQFDDIAPELKNHNRDHLVFEPNAGYADPLKTCIDFADQAKANDCSIIEGAEVTAIEPQQDAILVTTEYEQYFCRQLVIAGGAWSPKLLALFGESSKVRSKKIQADFFRHDPKDFTQPSLLDQKQDVFTRPISEEVRLIGTKTDVFDVEPDLPQQACAIQSNTCLTRVKALIGEVTLNKCGGRVGFDGYSPSGKGQIKRAEVDNRIVICDGYSGSGFQFAPAIGRQVALLLNSAL